MHLNSQWYIAMMLHRTPQPQYGARQGSPPSLLTDSARLLFATAFWAMLAPAWASSELASAGHETFTRPVSSQTSPPYPPLTSPTSDSSISQLQPSASVSVRVLCFPVLTAASAPPSA